MGQGVRKERARDQGGFTMVEGVLCLIVASLGILAVALGLLTSLKVDNRSNGQQRLDLALRTFTESAQYSRPTGGASCGVTDPPPSTSNLATVADSHARQVLEAALAKGDIQRWVDSRVRFTVTDVEYGVFDPAAAAVAEEQFVSADALTSCPAPIAPAPSYPVIRISVEACYSVDVGGVSECEAGTPVVEAQVIKRGGRAAA